MQNLQTLHFNSKLEATAAAGEALNALLVENKKTPVLLLLSGGSAFGLLDYVGESALSENLTISMLDERFSQDNAVNNFLQLQKLDFYALAFAKEVNFIGTLPRPEEKIEAFKDRFQTSLTAWHKNNPGGLIFSTLGMGQDGHMAGIFPLSDEQAFNNLFNSEAWVIDHDFGSAQTEKQRVTTTLTFLNLIDQGIALVCGEEKKPKFKEMLLGKTPVHLLPATAMQNIKSVKIFTNIK